MLAPTAAPARADLLRVLPLLLLALATLGSSCDSGGGSGLGPPPERSLDLATIGAGAAGVLRVYGSEGIGTAGVPVTGGHDVDGDGNLDIAMAAFRADPNGRTNAGEVFLHLGDGTIGGSVDTAVASAAILRIEGAAEREYTGSEIWMDDVTGDGVAELILARQNFTPDPGRIGAGAVTLLIGGAGIASHAATLAPIDLAAPPPPGITWTTLVGGQALGRFGIWVRTGDVTGDGVADLLVGADQENSNGDGHSGAVYLIRGGPHLASGGTIDLVDRMTALPGNLVQIRAPAGATEFHVGATCAIADLDGNGTAEVIAGATIERAGASFTAQSAPAGSAHSSAGAPAGAIYIAWDDNFSGAWPAGYSFAFDTAPGDTSEVRGGRFNIAFGEEILGGLDFDDDGNHDLFVGDIIGDATGGFRFRSGSGHLLYDAPLLRGAPAFDLDAPPAGLVTTTFIGPQPFDIASDTGLQGDFDDDGFPDLAFSSPHGSPYGRGEAGKIHVIHGQVGPWPAFVDLRWGFQPDPMDVRISEVHGVKAGDVLCYSADAADYDGDGVEDLIVNEMLGDGLLPEDANTGNVIVVSGALIRDLP